MELFSNCPVPPNQIPMVEYQKLTKSWFFSWPLDQKRLYIKLMISWLAILPVNIIIETGSIAISNNSIKLITLGLASALIVPTILIVQQLVGWKYILNRLLSENIEYEKSGWFDGDIWEKPINWQERDQLIAQYEVKPIIKHLEKPLQITTFLTIIILTFYVRYL